MPTKRVTVNLAPADLPKEGILLPYRELYPVEQLLEIA